MPPPRLRPKNGLVIRLTRHLPAFLLFGNGKRSYYKPAMRSTGWPDPAALLVKGRSVRIDGSQLHAYYVTWLEGKKQQFENVGKDALSAWQAKLTR